MSRIIVTLTDEMYIALKRQASNLKMPIAALVREAVRSYLVDQGENIETDVIWGGRRGRKLTFPETED